MGIAAHMGSRARWRRRMPFRRRMAGASRGGLRGHYRRRASKHLAVAAIDGRAHNVVMQPKFADRPWAHIRQSLADGRGQG
jgi:hypothetical protein